MPNARNLYIEVSLELIEATDESVMFAVSVGHRPAGLVKIDESRFSGGSYFDRREKMRDYADMIRAVFVKHETA